MSQPSTIALTSDTDSDSEPNTIHANVFWGHLKTPEKSRLDNELPQTILRTKITVRAPPNESPTRLPHDIPQNSDIVDGRIDTSQDDSSGSSLQEEDCNFELATTASPAVSIVQDVNLLITNEPSHHSPIRIPEINRKDDESNPTEAASPPVVLSSVQPSVSNTHSSEMEIPTTPRAISPIRPTCQSPKPSSPRPIAFKASNKTPIKLANDPSRCLVTPNTPQVNDNSNRKERRMKLKNNEDRGRFPLLSLSPASTNVLNLVQSPLRDVDNELTIPQSPVQKKAQRILLPSLSRSPTKPLGLFRLPSPVKLDDPNRIPARRVPIAHSPLRTTRDESLIYSPARRIPVISANKNMANHADTAKETVDASMLAPFTPSDLPFGPSRDIVPSSNYPQGSTDPVPSAGPSGFLQKRSEPTRGSNTINCKAGPSRLPVLSARSGTTQTPSNLLVVRKRLDPTPIATAPSQIPSPVKPKTGNNVFNSMSQAQSSSPELKRKRVEVESEDELNERPHKRPTAETRSIIQGAEGPSRIEIPQASKGALYPPKGTSDKMETDEPTASPFVVEPTSLSTKAKASVIPNSHPRRTPRVRKSPAVPLKPRARPLLQTSTRSLSSRSDSPSPSKLHAKPPSRPPSRSTSRNGYNLDVYPDNPRQLQWLTSHNTQRNQESVVELEHQTIRKFCNRPPSPSSRFRIDAKKSHEEREARAERRQRRDRSNNCLVPDVETIASCSNVTNHRHVRAPGDDDDYETPIKAPKPSQLHPGGVTKMVKWNRDLIATSECSEQQSRPKVKLKSCLSHEPTTIVLNSLGNVPHADEPLPGVVKEHIMISRFVYDDDIQEESPQRSKKKLV